MHSTGVVFLTGAATGAISGITSIEVSDCRMAKIGKILKGSGHGSRKVGGFCAVVGRVYCGIQKSLVDVKGTDDGVFNSLVSFFGTSALFKFAGQPKSLFLTMFIGGMAIGLTHSHHPGTEWM